MTDGSKFGSACHPKIYEQLPSAKHLWLTFHRHWPRLFSQREDDRRFLLLMVLHQNTSLVLSILPLRDNLYLQWYAPTSGLSHFLGPSSTSRRSLSRKKTLHTTVFPTVTKFGTVKIRSTRVAMIACITFSGVGITAGDCGLNTESAQPVTALKAMSLGCTWPGYDKELTEKPIWKTPIKWKMGRTWDASVMPVRSSWP